MCKDYFTSASAFTAVVFTVWDDQSGTMAEFLNDLICIFSLKYPAVFVIKSLNLLPTLIHIYDIFIIYIYLNVVFI